MRSKISNKKKRLRRSNNVTRTSTVALSPFSRRRKQAQLSGACRQQKRRKASDIQKEFKDDVVKWNDLGDPYGGMRFSIYGGLRTLDGSRKRTKFYS